MKKGKTPRENDSVEFWQSSADLLLALMLVLLLVISLLLLYLMQLPEQDFFSLWGTENANYAYLPEDGDSWRPDSDPYDGRGDDDDDWHNYHSSDRDGGDDDDDDDGGGGGRGDRRRDEDWDDEYKFEYPLPSAGGGDGNEWAKAAVLVNVLDGETNRAIREEGVTFELYQVYNSRTGKPEINLNNLHGTIRYLNTYYPEKIEYRNFSTTEQGLFFLPEKIEMGGYYFTQITEVTGYDKADIAYYEVEEPHDWDSPYVVSIPVFPAKNVVRVRLTDQETGEFIQEGTFHMTAADDIITSDGTIRFVANALADAFILEPDKDYGESSELYLGNYFLSQSTAPRYYTTVDDIVEVTLQKRSGIEPEIHEFFCEKTAIQLHLTDDLYTTQNLEGARFILDAENIPRQIAQTDSFGRITFTNLEKNTSYTLTQESASKGYQPDKDSYTFFVDSTGHINGEAKAPIELTNFIPRVSIGLRDKLLHGPVADRTLSLYDSSNALIRSWTTSGADEIVTGLGEGNYYVLIDNQNSSRFDFTVEDAQEIKSVSYNLWTLQSILTLAAGIVIIPLVIYFVVLLGTSLFRGKKRKK